MYYDTESVISTFETPAYFITIQQSSTGELQAIEVVELYPIETHD
jgi:hypothetical protein